MLDIDSRLDSRLRSFYEHIEQQSPRHDIAAVEAPLGHARRRTLNLLAGVAGVAVVAAGIAAFAAELSSHHGSKPPAPAGRAPDPWRLLPSASQLTAGLPSVSHTVIHFTRGTGSTLLGTFTPEGIIFIVWSCAGSGPINLHSTNNLVGTFSETCAGSNGGGIKGDTVPLYPAIHGKPLSLTITAGRSVAWEVAVADTGPVPPLPSLGSTTRPAGAHVLVNLPDGTGTTGLETFVPTGPYYVQYACTGTGTIDFSTPGSSTQWVSQNCANGAVRTQVGAKPAIGGPMNLTVEAAPRTLWEVVIYELPGPKT
jgi:hypothetical protein